MLRFRGSRTTSNAAALECRESGDTPELTNAGAGALAAWRIGKNGRDHFIGSLRHPIFGRLAGHEDVNGTERVCGARRYITGHAASAKQMGCFEARWLSCVLAGNLCELGSVCARCRDLLFIIAVVAMSLAAPTAKAQPPRLLSLSDTAKIRLVIRQNAGNAEIVRFADRREHPVRVVRGRQLSSGTSGAPGSDEIVTLAAGQQVSVRILRSAPAVMAGFMALVRVRPPLRAAEQVVAFASAGDRPVTVLRGMLPAALTDRDSPVPASDPCLDRIGACGTELDRVAFAVDGAESSHGADPGMWRSDLNGPQGPMQVSAAAAIDTGGGDRFDLIQNRQLGRAYLAQLFRRYGNWPDAVAAYNWGPGNMDLWIVQGRPAAGLPLEVERYRDRVLREGGIDQDPRLSLSRTGWPLSMP